MDGVKRKFLSLVGFPNNMLLFVTATSLVISPLVFVRSTPVQVSSGDDPIKHIVVIMKKNRSFDSYFGTYTGASGIPKDAYIPSDPKYPQNGCIRPFLSTADASRDMLHNYPTSIIAYHDDKMNEMWRP